MTPADHTPAAERLAAGERETARDRRTASEGQTASERLTTERLSTERLAAGERTTASDRRTIGGRGAAGERLPAAERLTREQLAAALPKLTDDPIGDPPGTVSDWNLANALTVLRLLLVPVFVVALFAHGGHDSGWRVIAWAVFAVAAVTDRIDGDIARKRHMVTEFGKLADPIADKALAGAALIGLSVLGDLAWWITVVVLGREVGVTVLRFWVIRHGVIPASRGGKLKTLLQGVAIGLYVLPLSGWLHVIATVIMYAAIVVALVTGVDYVARAIRLRREPRTAHGAPRLAA